MRRTTHTGQLATMLLAGLLMLSGCGGGGGLLADGGIGGTGITSTGSIQSKGSIEVNGVHYETDGARIIIEDASGSDAQLLPGMMVEVQGRIFDDGVSGVAEEVRFEDNLEGPVESGSFSTVSARLKTLRILGRTIEMESGVTRFDAGDAAVGSFAAIDASVEGGILEISGLRGADGTIRATWVRRTAGSFVPGQSIVEIKDRVTATAPGTISLSGLTVDIAANPQALGPMGGAVPEIGSFVEVKGSFFNGAILVADSVEPKRAVFAGDLALVHLEGILSGLDSLNRSFLLGSQPVSFTQTARFVGGTVSELAAGIRVEVEGSVSAGVLIAEKIEFEEDGRIEGNLASIDLASNTASIDGLPGLTVEFDPALTRLEDLSTLEQLGAGNHLRIRGRIEQGTTPTLFATEIGRLSQASDPEMELQGLPEQINETAGTLSLLGQLIETATLGENSFLREDIIIGRAAFFAAIQRAPLPLVKVQGQRSEQTGLPDWRQIEIED